MVKKAITLLLTAVLCFGAILFLPKGVEANGATVDSAEEMQTILKEKVTTEVEITLGADITLQYNNEIAGMLTIEKGRNVVIDLNDHTLTMKGFATIITSDAKLTIKNGTFVSEVNNASIEIEGTENKAELVFKNVDAISEAVLNVSNEEVNKSGSLLFLKNAEVTVDNSYLWTNCDSLIHNESGNYKFYDGNREELTSVTAGTTTIKTKKASTSSTTSSSGSSNVTAVVGASYVIEIPETIDFGNIAKVTGNDSVLTLEQILRATTLVIGEDKVLNVKISGDGENGSFVIENEDGDQIELTIKDTNGNTVLPNGILASFGAVSSKTFSVSLDRSTITNVGSYDGKIYFTFSVSNAN